MKENVKWDQTFWKLILLLFSVMLVAQFGLSLHLKKQAVPALAVETGATRITFHLQSGQKLLNPATVFVNGNIVGNFSGTSYTVVAKEGDEITIDTSNSPDVYDFIIDHSDSHLSSPMVMEDYQSSPYHSAQIGPIRVGDPS